MDRYSDFLLYVKFITGFTEKKKKKKKTRKRARNKESRIDRHAEKKPAPDQIRSYGDTAQLPLRSPNGKALTINEPPHDKTNRVVVRPAKTQISLGIRPV